MTTKNLEMLGRRVFEILIKMINNREPYHDNSLVDEINKEILIELPTDTKGWNSALEAIAKPCVGFFSDKPDLWSKATQLMHNHFNSTFSPNHVFADKNNSTVKDGITVSPVYLKLQNYFLKSLLENSSPSLRKIFFDSIDEWDVILSLEAVLSQIDLEPEEFSIFLQKAIPFVKNDRFAGGIFSRISRWAGNFPEKAKTVVDYWKNQEDNFLQIDRTGIQLLVEGIVHTNDAYLNWRDELIDRLIQSGEFENWALALRLSASAWPKNGTPPLEERFQLMLKQISKFPERLIEVGFQVLIRQARENPVESVQFGQKLLLFDSHKVLPKDERNKQLFLFALIVQHAAWKLEHDASVSKLEFSLPILVDYFPKQNADPLDSFLSNLFKENNLLVLTFLKDWLSKHFDDILNCRGSFENLFPLLSHTIGKTEINNFLFELLLSEETDLRAISSYFFDETSVEDIEEEAIKSLGIVKVEALFYIILGNAKYFQGETLVPLIFKILASNSSVVFESIGTLFIDAMENYPGLFISVLEKHEEGFASVNTPFPAYLHSLRAIWDKRLEVGQIKQSIPEVFDYRPSTEIHSEIINQLFQRASKKAHEASIVSLIAQNIPIIRGEGTIMSFGEGRTSNTTFQSHSWGINFSLASTIDPIAAAVKSAIYRKKGQSLLEKEKSENEGTA